MSDKTAGQNRVTCRLWLAWKLIRRQKLRTGAIFCGLLSSVFLLGAFGSFGYDFWIQVHQGSGENVGYDQTQMILIALVAVLLLLVAGCSGILLHNLYSLTFARRWRSLARLGTLGTGPRDLLMMTLFENAFFYVACVPSGWMLAVACGKIVGIQSRPPLWLLGGIMLWIWLVSCFCSLRPLWTALHRPTGEPVPGACHKKSGMSVRGFESRGKKLPRHRTDRKAPMGFRRFMTGKYRRANRGHHVRTVLTILAAVLLYVPVSYLIETNISVQRAELDAKHGIQYGCSPQSKAELEDALSECRRLADDTSVIYVSMHASASVEADDLSESLRKLLDAAGWRGDEVFCADSTLYFLEDGAYGEFLSSSGSSLSASSVLIDRYINRRSWSEDASPSYQEVPLLDDGKDCTGVEACYEAIGSISPDAATSQVPEGLSFGGDISLILPLSSLEGFLSPDTDYGSLYVCGKFQDLDESSFLRLEEALGEGSVGSLRDTRRILQEWYASMSGIHRAMNAICILLFSMAALNIFSMMLFQYMERRRGLAVLWSLGLSPGELLRILVGEHIRNLLAALGLGIPISGLLCYYIYGIFRRVWQVGFAFPMRQTVLMLGATCTLSVLSVFAEGLLMRHQDFLKDIKEII